ncbi:hypothetical protein BKA66DRAFT_467750 [Pyrenochaeta sp. MPI-SDFR-AT-0127]|nr:hypothetical protein BKA66DRAFT_467750 [Pyrenochaeta sp. MPI-SDFR-AT-0127]
MPSSLALRSSSTNSTVAHRLIVCILHPPKPPLRGSCHHMQPAPVCTFEHRHCGQCLRPSPIATIAKYLGFSSARKRVGQFVTSLLYSALPPAHNFVKQSSLTLFRRWEPQLPQFSPMHHQSASGCLQSAATWARR